MFNDRKDFAAYGSSFMRKSIRTFVHTTYLCEGYWRDIVIGTGGYWCRNPKNHCVCNMSLQAVLARFVVGIGGYCCGNPQNPCACEISWPGVLVRYCDGYWRVLVGIGGIAAHLATKRLDEKGYWSGRVKRYIILEGAPPGTTCSIRATALTF